MKQIIKNELFKLKDKKHVNQSIYQKFLKRLKHPPTLLRFENPQDHFCAFFLPFDLKSKSVYLGHHKKADDWIPPGGHIEENEHPLETIKREIVEELDYKLVNEKIELFDLTIKDIIDPKRTCKVHWDLWYLVYLNKVDFKFDKREFYQAEWYPIKKTLTLVKAKNYNNTIRKLLNLF